MTNLILLLLEVYSWIIIAEVIISWVPSIPRYHPLARLVHSLTEPVLRPIRRALPAIRMGNAYMDISPIIALLLVHVARAIVTRMAITPVAP